MDTDLPLPLLAGLSPAQFMRRHWQKKPLLVRAAVPNCGAAVNRAELFKLASSEHVESRLVIKKRLTWRMSSGPFLVQSLPPFSQRGWTLLVQGVDGHRLGMHELLQRFRFVPDARLDDVMVSFATPGGGVGPHFDSYDVFLLQASGKRRWRISQQKDLTLESGVPLKILQNFKPDEEFVLEAGDMLYLPPRYAHEGIAEACDGQDGKPVDCMTYSIGFRAPVEAELTAELLHKLAEFNEDAADAFDSDTKVSRQPKMYRDPGQLATATPAQLPHALIAFAENAVLKALNNPATVACALGESITTLKPRVWFETADAPWQPARWAGVCLDAKSRMMYDHLHVFINGESYLAKGADAALMHQLANTRKLAQSLLKRASKSAHDLLKQWYLEGWIHPIRIEK